jgi:dolichol-phosphate mannosyltransferase
MSIYSMVVPVHNEEAVIGELHRRLSAMTDSLDGDSEFIFVDDGSTDGSREILLELRGVDSRVKVVSLSRNFGHQIALSAGLDFAAGSAVVTIDGDLQDPPELIPEMAARWREGYEVVHAQHRRRAGEGRLMLATRRLFYRLMSRASDIELPVDTGDFRLADRRIVEIIRGMHEPNRYLRGMMAWVGFRQTTVPFDRDERYAGRAKYTMTGLVRLGIDGLMGFSTVPLRLAIGLGFLISALAFIAGFTAVVLKIAGAFSPPGWASLTVIISFLAGIQLIVTGMVGLYVGRSYEQGKERPLYLVADADGFSSEELPRGLHTSAS